MKRTPVDVRFWRYVRKDGDGCWEWVGSKNRDGYGLFSTPDRRTMGAHRMSYILSVGPIPSGMFVCHHCDNRSCVRPDHLFVGTPADNTADCRAKGRMCGPHNPVPRYGTDQKSAKLNPAKVRELVSLWLTGEYTAKEVVSRFGVSDRALWAIIQGRNWRSDVSDEERAAMREVGRKRAVEHGRTLHKRRRYVPPTHCKYGHLIDTVRKCGRRRCGTCARTAGRLNMRKRRAEAKIGA